MKIIIGEPGSGKTKQLIQDAAENGGTIVCANPNAIIAKAGAYGYYGIKVVSYQDYLDNFDKDIQYYIDEVEKFIEVISGRYGTIVSYTVNKE